MDPMDIIICVVLFACVVVMWAAIILGRKKKRPVGKGHVLSAAGTTVVVIDMILNGFDVVTGGAFIGIMAAGLAVEIAALILTWVVEPRRK